MIPAALIGVLLESEIEMLFDRRILLVCAMLVITGLLLLLADRALFFSPIDRIVGANDSN